MELADYRISPQSKGYMVDKVEGVDCPWRVVFVVDGVECGHGEYQSWDQADAAGEEWMFSGWGDES
jgi:hypothetical protein